MKPAGLLCDIIPKAEYLQKPDTKRSDFMAIKQGIPFQPTTPEGHIAAQLIAVIARLDKIDSHLESIAQSLQVIASKSQP